MSGPLRELAQYRQPLERAFESHAQYSMDELMPDFVKYRAAQHSLQGANYG